MNKHILQSVPCSLIAALLSAAVLTACGSGGSTAQSPAADAAATIAKQTTALVTKPSAGAQDLSASLSTKEAGIGAVTGFGSVIVEGVKYEDNVASVTLDIDPTQPAAGTLKDVKLGVRLAVQAEGKQARSFTLGAEVMGKVSSVGSDSVQVAGQTVKASADTTSPTVFEGVSNLAALAYGDFVEVYGLRDAAGVITASRIERKNAGAATITRVAGNLATLNRGAKTFVIGSLTVSYAAAVRIQPSVELLGEGLRVAVYSEAAPVAGVLHAKAVKVVPAGREMSGKLRVAGPVRELNAAALSFTLDGLNVDASKASFTNGSLSDLVNGTRVRVAGSFANGVVTATEVSFQKPQGDAQVDVKGDVTDFVSSASFKVRGVTFDASTSGIQFINGDASKLVSGALVRIKGQVQGDVVKPVSVEFLSSLSSGVASTPDLARVTGVKDAGFSIQGSVADFNVDTKTIRVNGSSIQLPLEVADIATLEALKNGTQVQVQGSVVNGQVVATKVVIK